mmetsp:Transcript_39498/g.71141  ORF Transcript_39498/g.71141 Transcript_39498/m.71141 type:complete len:202 (+) Transcript_39498:3-608(+)
MVYQRIKDFDEAIHVLEDPVVRKAKLNFQAYDMIHHLVKHSRHHDLSTVRQDVVPMDKETGYQRGYAIACTFCHLAVRHIRDSPDKLKDREKTCSRLMEHLHDMRSIVTANMKLSRIWRGAVQGQDIQRICVNTLEDHGPAILENAGEDDCDSPCEESKICNRNVRLDIKKLVNKQWKESRPTEPFLQSDTLELSAYRDEF